MNALKYDPVQAVTEAFVRREAPPPEKLEFYRQMISDVLTKKGIDATRAHKADAGLWIVPAQPAPVVVRLLRDEEDGQDVDFIETVMRLVPLPAKNLLAFYRFLLETNLKLNHASFCVSGDSVFLRAQRRLEGLDEVELDDMISSLLEAAEDYFLPALEQFTFGASILR